MLSLVVCGKQANLATKMHYWSTFFCILLKKTILVIKAATGWLNVLLLLINGYSFESLRVRDAIIITIGYRESEMALQLGTLFTTEEALKVGMVDRIVPQEEVVQEAVNEVRKWQKIPGIYRIWNEFSFHTVFMKRVVFLYPRASGEGI